jgi:regulator of cell morphogenesis and NO signaling
MLNNNITIGAVVAAIPEATSVFKEYNIDFCCGGHRTLTSVIEEKRINEKEIFARLNQIVDERKSGYEGSSFTEMSPAVLTAYIEDTHHSYLRQTLPKISDLLNTVLRVHGKNHRELFEIYRIFGQLKTDLEQHLLKEETLLFPVLEDNETSREEIIRLTDDIITEHEGAGEILRELRSLTNDYKLPEGACETYGKTYKKLEELEQDLHQHIHLENNILLDEYSNRK